MTVKFGFLLFISFDLYSARMCSYLQEGFTNRTEQAQEDFKCFAIYWHGGRLDHLYKLFVPSQVGSTLNLSLIVIIISEKTKFESFNLNDL